MVTSPNQKARFIQAAADEMDAKLGFVYATPIDVSLLPVNQAKLLKTINAKLASGRMIMANALGGQDATVNAYAMYLVKEAEVDLMSIANGQVDLKAPEVDASSDPVGVIEDPTVADPYARIPSGWNPDATSAVTAFEKNFMGGSYPGFLWTPDTNIDADGRVDEVR